MISTERLWRRRSHDPVPGRHRNAGRSSRLEVVDERVNVLRAAKRVGSLVEDREAVAAGREEAVQVYGDLPSRDAWVTVTGRFDVGGGEVPRLVAMAVTTIAPPDDPYE